MRVEHETSPPREVFLYPRTRSSALKDLFLPIEWLSAGKVRFLDQTLLPQEETWVETADYRVVAEAIRRLQVRGAPLIGIAAAYGVALAALESAATDAETLRRDVTEAADALRATRPTAVNLSWALDRCLRTLESAPDAAGGRETLVRTARKIHEQDVAANQRIGAFGAELLPAGASVMTHCNAGSLATGGYGTALGILRAAWTGGQLRHVIATETRPLLQGARLTAWELKHEAIPFTLIADSAAGSALRRGLASAVVVGADRIAANGDVANKIGTYPLAVLAKENGVPFYVAAPTSTIDLSLPSGDEIPIEERSADEVTDVRGVRIAPTDIDAANPAFDVTPNGYVSAIVTENGVARPPYEESLRRACEAGVPTRG
ncbi:MAG: S-methyl-5-thioribose-1-phosphate isomerase [Chloroflexi bacterium]|nr:S-methyl-5-thioribose-1-phosphate isomerase [Chloroflexota bacterium]MCI0813622.1 S-methyl-5-thioribose-1-phosphate isomerase [Chloroflexota bacterium]MCI0817432.1 S-methyl-5-thioribose-1-phosphate isomerase [Chloroflexota bacterium]MCI0818848.1 S-methyl-5-thioribose-1-phosphate isomerase [Chloroflexota bacterium]MCI0831214.1 S-methyl-5-thioribose-1-phosphate isomerase [Chloroflexota bacterium]